MKITGFEIDFLPVEKKIPGGDAILFRYKEESGDYKVILIDGGFTDTADTIIQHMKEYYGTDVIDHVVCSHPDQDHINGIERILKECEVKAFWINDPLEHVKRESLPDNDEDGFTKSKADIIKNLITLAKGKGISVNAPVQGKEVGPLIVCSPSENFYKELVEGTLQRQTQMQGNQTSIVENIKKFINWMTALWNEDALYPNPETPFCNESSTVLFGKLMAEEYKVLLTADAGIEALTRAEEYLCQNQNFEAGTLNFMQMPHHGSRHNVNSVVLDSLLGSKEAEYSTPNKGTSFASVAKESDEHPKKSVGNAFYTRGYQWTATKGVPIRYNRGDVPDREGWSPISFGGFEEQVEEL